MKPDTTDELRAKLADSRRDQAYHSEMVKALALEIASLERRLELAERGIALPMTYPKGTLSGDDMEALSPSRGANISAGKTKGRWPLQTALIKRNLSLPEWARAQRKPKIEVETAKSWLKKPGRGGRRTPRFWADRVAVEFVDGEGKSEVPAVAASWPNGIAED